MNNLDRMALLWLLLTQPGPLDGCPRVRHLQGRFRFVKAPAHFCLPKGSKPFLRDRGLRIGLCSGGYSSRNRDRVDKLGAGEPSNLLMVRFPFPTHASAT